MKKTSAALIRDVCQRWNIPIDRDHIIGHYQIDGIRRPNCPAYNKAIIDELISLARAETNQDKLARGLKMIADGLQLLKEATV